jgi:hypothetical protein
VKTTLTELEEIEVGGVDASGVDLDERLSGLWLGRVGRLELDALVGTLAAEQAGGVHALHLRRLRCHRRNSCNKSDHLHNGKACSAQGAETRTPERLKNTKQLHVPRNCIKKRRGKAMPFRKNKLFNLFTDYQAWSNNIPTTLLLVLVVVFS